MNAAYVCSRIKELCTDYRDALNFGQDKEAAQDLESLKRLLDEFQTEQKEHMDSVFFSGELNDNIGEKNVQYPDSVERYKQRKRKRRDCKAVKRFKERRQQRLDATGSIDWITVENGEHVPLQGGKAVGGPLNGRDFSKAKSVKAKSDRGSASAKGQRPVAQAKTIDNLIKRTANLKNEQYRIIDEDGNVVLEKKGDQHSVSASVGEKRQYLSGCVSLHNHPDGGTFSADDFSDFGYGAKEIVVSGPDGSYSLRNDKVGTKEQFNGWVSMRNALMEEVPQEMSFTYLQKTAQENLKNSPENQKMHEITTKYLEMHKNGASKEELDEYYKNSGYEELQQKQKENLKNERRRLEVEPQHNWLKENASKYGFTYIFTPADRKTKPQRANQDAKEPEWITVNGNHIPIDDEGNPVGGQQKALGKVSDGSSVSHKHDGTVVGNHVRDWSNSHVSAEERELTRNDVKTAVSYGRQFHGIYNPKAFHSAGAYVRDEIKRRNKLRKQDEDYDKEINGEPEIEDIYDVLRDVRDFGPPESFDQVKFGNCEIDQDRANELLKEALDRYPTDWYNAITSGDVEVNVIDYPGRAHYDGYSRPRRIFVYAKENPEVVRDLGVPEDFCDNELVRQMTHELGHYFEDVNSEVQIVARNCLEKRTKNSPEVSLNDGFMSKPDSFFKTYTGKQYYDGSTEITSTMVETLQYSDPFKYLSDMNWDTGKKDRESLRYILGVLAGL